MSRPSSFQGPIASPVRRRIAIPAGLALLALASLLGGCAENPHQARTREYQRDSQICRAQHPLGPEVRKVPDGTDSLDAVTGIDTENYLHCMERLGYQQDAKTDPLLKALSVCRRNAERTDAGSPRKPGSPIDYSVFRACLKQRGIEADPGLVPGSPQSPIPP